MSKAAWETDTCLTCRVPLTTVYCSGCGQKRAGRLTFRSVFGEAVSHLVNLDFALARTLILMFRDPGKVCREYILGRRSFYISPIKYAFLVATFYVLIVTFFRIPVYPTLFGDATPEQLKIFNLIFSLISYLIFIKILLLAFIQRLLFRKSGYNFAECYVWGLFVTGHIIWFHFLFAFMNLLRYRYAYPTVLLLDMIYVTWAVTRFYQNRRVGAILKGVLLFILYHLINMAIGIFIAWIVFR